MNDRAKARLGPDRGYRLLGTKRLFGAASACPLSEGGLNRPTQHFILKGKDGV